MKTHPLKTIACTTLILTMAGAATADAAAGPRKLRAPRTFPLVIDAPGSYVLIGNFTVPSADTDAISITASDVTLDLGGFTISGPVVCGGIPTTCSPSGSGFGIFTSGAAANTTVRNGTVRGMGREGIHLSGGIIEGIRAVSNGQIGISGSYCVIRDSVATQNGTDGISATSCVVTNNVAAFNGDSGITADKGPVTANAANNNGGVGITSQGTASGSAAIGFNAAVANTGAGISADFASIVGNVSYANDSYGVSGGGGVGFGLNAFTFNNSSGNQTFSGNELGGNVCGLDLSCP